MSGWSHDEWVAAWGANLPMIADAEDFGFPQSPEGTTWLLARVLDGKYRKYWVALYDINNEATINYKTLDVDLYGHGAPTRWAQNLLETLSLPALVGDPLDQQRA